MKDCNGKKIMLNTTLKCINDIQNGVEYKASRWCDAFPHLCIYIDNIPTLLSEFDTDDNGCIVDFEVV